MAAAARAAHLIVDAAPPIFADTLAGALLGDRATELVGYHRARGDHPILSTARTTATTRSRFTEDRLAERVGRGVSQYVILGAGLDSFAYRARPARPVRVFEVDHPATQRWKRRRLADAGITVPDTVTFVPADLADLDAAQAAAILADSGFDRSRPAFVSWLGVTLYLPREVINEILAMIGGFAPGTWIVVDHMLPAGLRDNAGQTYVDAVMPVSADMGEPWLTFLAPDDAATLLHRHGIDVIGHIRQRDTIDAELWNRSDPLRPVDLSMLTYATIR